MQETRWHHSLYWLVVKQLKHFEINAYFVQCLRIYQWREFSLWKRKWNKKKPDCELENLALNHPRNEKNLSMLIKLSNQFITFTVLEGTTLKSKGILHYKKFSVQNDIYY